MDYSRGHDHYLCRLANEGRMSKPCRGAFKVGGVRVACPCCCHKRERREQRGSIKPLPPIDRHAATRGFCE